MKRLSAILTIAAMGLLAIAAKTPPTVSIDNDVTSLKWVSSDEGWQLRSIKAGGLETPVSGWQNTVIFAPTKPDDTPVDPSTYGSDGTVPEREYRYLIPSWEDATWAVALNRAGTAFNFVPRTVEIAPDSTLTFKYDCPTFSIIQRWSLTDDSCDVNVSQTLTALTDGYYSIATPSLSSASNDDVEFALIPGTLHGHKLNSDFIHAYAYGWDIPTLPVIYRERHTTLPTSMLTTADGLTLAVTANHSTVDGLWRNERRADRGRWLLGLSAMNRSGELSPTLYHPILGQEGSYLNAGDSITFTATYTLTRDGWWPVYNHIANGIYHLQSSVKSRHNRSSLSERLSRLHKYVVSDSNSRWRLEIFEGDTIGAQDYLGGVYMAKKDAMKNADYGAMWMLASITSDSVLTQNRLPYALKFKLSQQHAYGPMQGASRGQYYLRDSKRFVEEWGPYTEPIATTYYMTIDLGNIALFEPHNDIVKESLRHSADRLLQWQKPDGSWEVAYANDSQQPTFTDLKDYRPTFYGLVVAYRVLGDKKYLDGAIKSANWLIDNAVNNHKWLGVCGDTRFAPDFCTAQAVRALLDLYDICGDERLRDAAIATARFYATSVYTAPQAGSDTIIIRRRPIADWQINPVGLQFEHGGVIGSANLHGPVLLSSHAGLFVDMFKLTSDSIFINLARASAIGRDSHVNDATGVASYYWDAMDNGAGPYPHHAWWQVGWITDYLLSELNLRSNGNISFPAGFITPKVGPHRTYGFAPGRVNGHPATLTMIDGAFTCDDPDTEIVLARNDYNLFVMILNDTDIQRHCTINVDTDKIKGYRAAPSYEIPLDSYSLHTITLDKDE